MAVATRWGLSLLVLLIPSVPALAGPPSQPASAPAKIKITIGKDTTFVDGPVNADGTINYLAAFNARLSQGVTPANNAAIPLLKALGPELIPESVRAKTLKELGLDSLPEKGPYYLPIGDFGEHANKASEQRDQAMKRAWQAKEFPQLADWLQANEKPLDAIAEATKLPRLYLPMLSDHELFPMLVAVLPNLSRFRDAGRALVGRAMLRWGTGDANGARADILAVHRLARLVSQHDTLIAHLVAMALDGLACEADLSLAGGRISAADAKGLLGELAALPHLPRAADAIDRGDRFVALDCAMGLARASLKGRKYMADSITSIQIDGSSPKSAPGDKPVPDILDWDVILRTFNARYDRIAEAGGKPSFAARKEAWAECMKEGEKLAEAVTARWWRKGPRMIESLLDASPDLRAQTSKEMAELLMVVLLPTLGRADELRDRAAMRLELSKVALALAAYRAEKGQFPDSLAALAPAYMKELPKDLFTDGALVYKKTPKGYLLYSLGPNMKDDGGKTMEESPESFDIVVKVE